MGRVEKDSTLHQRFASVDATATATALTKAGTGNILVVMLGFADVVTSIGAAFGDAVVGVGNQQPLLHLVSPDQALPTTLLSAPTSTMMLTIFKEPSIGCYFAKKRNNTEQVHQTKVEIGDPRW